MIALGEMDRRRVKNTIIPSRRLRLSAFGCRSSVIGHRSSVIGHRSSVIGHRSSAIGHRSSVIGLRSSVVGFPSSIFHLPSVSVLDQIVIVLNEPQDPVNIAATIRAMKNMGVSHLRLVNPVQYDPWRIEGVAHGTRDLVDQIEHFDSLTGALADCVRVAAFAGKRRAVRWAVATPREMAAQLIETAAARARGAPVRPGGSRPSERGARPRAAPRPHPDDGAQFAESRAGGDDRAVRAASRGGRCDARAGAAEKGGAAGGAGGVGADVRRPRAARSRRSGFSGRGIRTM